MKMRIAILAACASTLALAQADVARANYGAASESKSPVSTTEIGQEQVIVVAQSIICPGGVGFVMGGVDLCQKVGRGKGNGLRKERAGTLKLKKEKALPLNKNSHSPKRRI